MWTGKVHTAPFCSVISYHIHSFLPSRKGNTNHNVSSSALMTQNSIDLLHSAPT